MTSNGAPPSPDLKIYITNERNEENAKKWTGSVLPRVWMTVVFWTLYTMLFVLNAELGGYRQNLSAPSTAPITLIGFAISLLLGFRTNSAYERWYEGRKLFETACARVREMVRWWTVFYPPKNIEELGRQLAASRASVACIYALMYHLRDQNPIEYPDCVELIPREKNGSLAIETSNPNTLRYHFETTHERPIPGIKTRTGKGKTMTAFSMPGTWRNPHQWAVPGQIVTLLYSYYDTLNPSKVYPAQLTDLANTQVSLERILSTPMPPIIYSIHLKMVLTVYFVFLPFQFMNWGYWLIPLTAAVSFVMCGFEAIGLELENPFGFDANNLALSEIAATLRRDIDFFVEHPIAPATEWYTDVVEGTLADMERDLMVENNLTAEDLNRTKKYLDENELLQAVKTVEMNGVSVSVPTPEPATIAK